MKKYKHIEDECCLVDEQVNCSTQQEDEHDHSFGINQYLLIGVSFVVLMSGLYTEYVLEASFLSGNVKLIWYLLAYVPVAFPVIIEATESIKKGNVFNEFFLMTIATVGAFLISEYPEGVAVMLFYAVGELFQSIAVKKAKKNIKALLDVRPKTASVFKDGKYMVVNADTVQIGEVIQVKVGEKIPLDGKLLSKSASLNTSAITGESKPDTIFMNEKVLAGSINLLGVIEVEVEKLFNDSSIAKILDLVQNATAKKAKTELLIRKLAKIYTPIVTYLAIIITFVPYFFVDDYVFYDWFYRALIFLVISCPCALVISIPLGYFGGLGAASKNGILFKGAAYMDVLTNVNTFVMDKTGTVTKGVFAITKIIVKNGMNESNFMENVLALESKSTHPIAKAIIRYDDDIKLPEIENVKEIPGKGLKGKIAGVDVLVGNKKLLIQYDIEVPEEVDEVVESMVLVAIDYKFAGYIIVADEIKEDALQTILNIRKLGINNIIMLSGDKESITQKVAKELSIENSKGGLLPEEKLNEVLELKKDASKIISFIGDGINDAPVLAASHIGIAMGAMGSDVAIETADVIFQTDEPSKFITAYKISKATQNVIWQNITLALVVKTVVLTLGALGMATMWQAVFSDVGVSFLAILNAIRLQKMQW